MPRSLKYVTAINEALTQAMASDPRVCLIGQGVTSPWYVGATTTGLLERFGAERVIDTPVSESGVTGAAVGAALGGLRPVVVHPRMDFMYYGLDAMLNHAANWHYMFGGSFSVPVVFWGIVNRGGEQAAQHSQSIHAIFGHIPGLKVVLPSTAHDAKGLLLAAIADDNPVVFVDDRWLYEASDDVPEKPYTVNIGEAALRRHGKDCTLVASSWTSTLAAEAAVVLETQGVDCELIDLRSLTPLDADTIINSVQKTGHLVVADGGWHSFGAAAEVVALVTERAFAALKAPARRVTLPDAPAPSSGVLEQAYYPAAADIVSAVRETLS